MPNWIDNVKDPSARTLQIYKEIDDEEIDKSQNNLLI